VATACAPAGGPDPREEPHSLLEIERREVVSALERHSWIQSRAARELGITRTTLYRLLGTRAKQQEIPV